MRHVLELTGTSPMLHHGIRLADEDDEFTVAIKKLTGKANKTKEDYDEIGRLEWYGGLYAENGAVVFPTANVKKCLEQAGKVKRGLGAKINRAVYLLDGLYVPLRYDGPQDIDELYASPAHRLRVSVGVNRNRVMRIRPRFPTWSLSVNVELLTTAMNPDEFIDVVHLAGIAEGLGDGRRVGFGRFTAEVKAA